MQVANNLDKAISVLGMQPLKGLVQVNTSGEECKHHMLQLPLFGIAVIFALNCSFCVEVS